MKVKQRNISNYFLIGFFVLVFLFATKFGAYSGNATKESVCVDTDPKNIAWVAGEVTKDGKTYSDECVKKSSFVKDFFCNKRGAVSYVKMSCPKDCQNGACVLPCVDSDGGKDLTIKGKVSIDGKGYSDYCEKDGSIREQICDKDKNNKPIRRNLKLKCQDGEKCVDGRCLLSGDYCIFDYSNFKKFKKEAENFFKYCETKLSLIRDMLGSNIGNRKAILLFEEGGAPAWTVGDDRIFINVNNPPEYPGFLLHEGTHFVQDYKGLTGDRGWVMEGIADLVRFKLTTEEDEPGWAIGCQGNEDLSAGYGCAAAFFLWVEEKCKVSDIQIILNNMILKGKDTNEVFKELCGKNLTDLWDSYKSTNPPQRIFPTTQPVSGTDYICPEDQKSGLCGPIDKIFPLNNKIERKDVYVYGPGKVLETSDFRITLDAPEFLVMKNKYEPKVSVENLKGEPKEFKYAMGVCDSASVCADFYTIVESSKLEGSVEKTGEKGSTFFQTTFKPNEKKYITVTLTPEKPTMTDTFVNFLILRHIDEEFNNPYTIFFQSWVKPDDFYFSDPNLNPPILPELILCNGGYFPRFIIPPRYIVGGAESYFAYGSAKCCDKKTFYPDFNCCSNADCQDELWIASSNGYCVDGRCMPETKPTNKAFGTKRLLIGSRFNAQDICKDIPADQIDPQFQEDISRMEQYYDFMAKKLLDKPSNYLNFEIVKVIEVPSGLNNYFGEGKTDYDILNYLSTKCGINTQEFDIIILPTTVAQMGESAGWALNIGDGKVELYEKGNVPTLIHETGHLFGCSDLYTGMGGKLQWGKTLYGDYRNEAYNLISQGKINELPLKTFQVCRGEMGWTDLNNNGITDIEE